MEVQVLYRPGKGNSYLKENWPKIREQLVNGEYIPKPVMRVEIPKPDGGTRRLGVPAVLDRLIQEAIHQILSPVFESAFSDNSFAFRPGRSAHQAILQAGWSERIEGATPHPTR